MLELHSNSLGGSIPDNLCQPNLAVLSLSNNELTGDLGQLLNCIGAQYVLLSSNKLSGNFPDGPVRQWQGFMALDVSSNAIHGTLPMAIIQLPKLRMLSVSNNWWVVSELQSCKLLYSALFQPAVDSLCWFGMCAKTYKMLFHNMITSVC